MDKTFEMVMAIAVLSFWFLFPIGVFISIRMVDANTDQIIRLDHQVTQKVANIKFKQPWRLHLPATFQRWIRH